LKPNVLILTGYGINAEKELKWAFDKAGANSQIIHLEDVIENKNKLKEFQILAFPGGFSYGDHIASGKVFANMVKYNLIDEVKSFIEKTNLVIGICNGFQIITKLGIVPDLDKDLKQTVSLTENRSGHFEDRWVWVKVQKNKSPWLNGIDKLYLPVRHGEGNLIAKDDETLNTLISNDQAVLTYFNPDSDIVEYPFNLQTVLQKILQG